MKYKSRLISYHQQFILEYIYNGRVITLTKHLKDGSTERKFLYTRLNKEKQRKLCAFLWLAEATPYTAKELAEEFLDSTII